MKSTYLLDVNVLISLLWPQHPFHGSAQEWFKTKGRQGWATCPITQAGFVRITSNPGFSPDALTPEEAMFVLANSEKGGHHRFWADSISYVEAVALFNAKLAGHQRITDAYLLGLAIHNGGKLATFDKGIAALLPPSSPHAHRIEIVGG